MSLIQLKEDLKNKIANIASKLIESEVRLTEVIFSTPQMAEQGDFSCPIALKLAKQISKNPLEVAQNIANKLGNLPEIKKIEVAAPGFINFFLSDEFLIQELKSDSALKDNEKRIQKEKVIVDYSSPNIAKPLGIHHILSTVIGQATVNLHRACGHEVVAWNYLGDWGTQFGKLIYAYKNWGNHDLIEKDPINELLKLYVEFHNQAETDSSLEDKGRAEFKKLEEGDSENRELWQWIVEVSKQDLEKVYAKLGGIEFDVYSGEADREEDLPVILEEGVKQGIFEKGENGALIVDLEKEKMIPFLVQKSDGATLYSTRDIASVKVRTGQFKGQKLIYVVDVAQALHFQQLFATVAKFDWFKSETELVHLKFGRMSFKDGKMSTRKGNIIHLEELLDEACVRAKQIILEKNPELENLEDVARIIGVGAVKYSILSQSPETNIVFDWDKIISFEGNSGPYLQYSCARANSILRQSSVNNEYSFDFGVELNFNEVEVLKQLARFKETIEEACYKLKPHLLALYLFELCQKFNSFYANSPVLNCEDKNLKAMRLRLVGRFKETLATGLKLLSGIEVPEKM